MAMMMVMYRRIPAIRRYTGGGTVVVDKNTAFVTLIMNVMITMNSYNHDDDDDDDQLCPFIYHGQSKDVPCPPYPREIMKWTTDQFYKPLFTCLARKNPLSNQALSDGGLDDDHIVAAAADHDDDINNKVDQCISL